MTVRSRMALMVTLALVAGLGAAVPALAGGWATVGLDPPLDRAVAGQETRVELTVLQHGRTPLEGVAPRVLVRSVRGDARLTFPARPTGRPGVYVAKVTFPRRGAWRLAVHDGFAAQHSFGRVRVSAGPPAAPAGAARGSGGGLPWSWPALLAAAGVGLAAALVAGRSRRGPRAALR